MEIKVKLSKKAELYFNDVMYGLEGAHGGECTKSEVINHCLEILSLFEEDCEMDLLHYMTQERPDIFKSAIEYCKQKKLQIL